MLVVLALATSAHAAINNCIEAGPTAANGTETCRTCSSNTYKNNYTVATACFDCPRPYFSCSDANTCLTCQAGYYLSGVSCLPCTANCANCQLNGQCTACNVGYGFINGGCIKCSDNCLDCTSSTYCTRCQDKYYFVSTDNNTRRCTDDESGLGSTWWWVLIIAGSICLLASLAVCFLWGRNRAGPEYASSYVAPNYQTAGYTQLVDTRVPAVPILTPPPQLVTQTTKTTTFQQPIVQTPAPIFQQITPGVVQTQTLGTQPGAGSYYVQGVQPRVASTTTVAPSPYQPQGFGVPPRVSSTVGTGF